MTRNNKTKVDNRPRDKQIVEFIPGATVSTVLCPPPNPNPLARNGYLNRASSLQQFRQLILLRLQVRVAADMLLFDEDVGHGALMGDFFEGVLDGGAVLCCWEGKLVK